MFQQSQQVSSLSHTTWLEKLGSLFKVSKSAPFHTPHVFEFFLLYSKVSKSAAFHTAYGSENSVSFSKVSISAPFHTPHVLDFLLQLSQQSAVSKSASQQSASQQSASQQVSGFSHNTWFDFFVLLSKVSKSAAFHTPHGSENLLVEAKSASQQLFTHHMIGKFRFFLKSQQVSTISHTTCV